LMRKVDDCRIVVGAIGPRAYRCFRAEEEVRSAAGTEQLDFESIAKRASLEFEIIEDANGPAWYKRQVAMVIIRDLLRRTVDLAKGGEAGA
jgi:CO/xanthine dehydrogenase FAD-binding subunit